MAVIAAPMPGQVWRDGDGYEREIVRVTPGWVRWRRPGAAITRLHRIERFMGWAWAWGGEVVG